jgi:hypothetical protein
MTGTVDEKLTEYVREAWRNACENGYEAALRAMTPEDLASDLIAYDCDIAECATVTNDLGWDHVDYDGLQERVVAILPQVLQ